MDNRPVMDKPAPEYVLGSKLKDRLLGIGLALAWWVLGVILAIASGRYFGWVLLALLVAYLVQAAVLAWRTGTGTLLRTLLVATMLMPVAISFGFFGMCALKGFGM